MNIKEVSAEGLAREVQITVAAADLAGKLESKIDSIKDQVQLKGFRPGKVPVAHIRKTYGEQLMGEIIQETVNESSQQMLTDRDERPAMQPEIKLVGETEEIINGSADLVYYVTYEVIPPVTLADFSKLKLEKPVVDVDDARVDEALERLASSRKEFVARAKTAKAKDGDRVKIDFIGRIDGEAFEGGAGEGFDLELGSGQFIPGFEEQLVGTKAGDKKDVEVSFPEEYGASELAGKAAVFECTVHEVNEPKDAEINEDFATSLGMESLEKLKDAMREQIGRDYEQMSRGHMKKDLLDQLSDGHDFDLPPSMVEMEFNQIWHQFEHELENNQQKLEDLDESEEDLRAEYRGIAERRVRTGLVLAEVGNNNEIQVTQEELNQGLMQRVQQFPGQEQQVFEYFQQNPEAMAQIRAPIFEEKVVDFICELAKVSDKKVSLEELMMEPGAEEAEKPKPEKKAPAKRPPPKNRPPKRLLRRKNRPRKPLLKNRLPRKRHRPKKQLPKRTQTRNKIVPRHYCLL